jgi:hypothetical protein
MAEKVDLSVDIKESTGEYFPTVYIDFMDISYGRLPDWGAPESEEPSFEYARYSMDPENGTHIDGSLSIYFTKEAMEPVEDLSEWIDNNFGKLYIYTFLCPYQSINRKVENGTLSVKELFESMQPGRKATFSSAHPAYNAVIAEMKEAFLTNTWRNTGGWRAPYLSYDSGDQDLDDFIASGEFTRSFLEANINTPGHLVYNRFWGNDSNYGGTPGAAMTGPWPLSSELGDPPAGDDATIRDYVEHGRSFMEHYLGWTLNAYGGSGKTDREYNYGVRLNVQKLSDLVYTNGKTNIRVEPIFDKDGDQLAVLANIPINFSVTSEILDDAGEVETSGAIQQRLADLDSIYFIGVVGTGVYTTSEIRDLNDDEEHPGDLVDWAKELNPTLFNLNFGDITYQKVFASPGGYSNTELFLADQTEEIFVTTADNTPHPSNPIMSLNGTYHASKPVDHSYVVSNMMQLVKKFAPYIDEERSLRQNVANLSRILASDEYTVDIMRRLQFFRRTYVDKALSTKSGKLYAAFKKIIYPINRQIMKQPRLKKIRITNNKIIDSRVTAPNLSYAGKSGAGNCEPGITSPGPVGCKGYAQMGKQSPSEPFIEAIDNIYLPRAWHSMARRTMYTIPISGRELLGEYAQYILEEGLPTITVGTEIVPFFAGGDASGVVRASDVTYDDASFSGMGDGMEALGSWSQNFVTGRMSGVGFQNPDDLSYGWSGNYPRKEDGDLREADGDVGNSLSMAQDTVVENKGIFFFDYEKALNSHSKLSFVLPIHHIQRFLGLHVPYCYYRVKKVTMERKENVFLTSMPEDNPPGDGVSEFVTIKMELHMDNTKTYPFPDKSTYSGFSGEDGLFYRYGQPTVRVASAELLESTEVSWGAPGRLGDIDTYVDVTRTEELDEEMSTSYDGDGSADYAKGVEALIDAFAADGAHLFGSVEPKSTAEKKSHLGLYNFDAPLGVRFPGGEGSWGAYSSNADASNRPSGQLFDYEGWVVRGGYRLMAFNYADYMDDDVAYYNTIGINEFLERLSTGDPSAETEAWAKEIANFPTNYKVKIEVEDQSLKMIGDIYNIFSGEYNDFVKHYYNRAVASCSFNNIDDRFNDFFVKGINETYPEPEQRYWMRGPYMLNLGRQVFFNTFGGADFVTDSGQDNVVQTFDAMEAQSTKLATLIGPDDGRMIHLQKFKVDFEKFLNIIKPQVDSPTTTRSGRRLFGTRDGAHSYGPGGYTSPVFNYHPVYNRVLEIAGTSDASPESGDDYSTQDVVSRLWADSLDSSTTYIFENTFPIDQPIYGDLFLSNLYSWEYTPPNLDVSFSSMWKWLKNLTYLLDPKSFVESRGMVTPGTIPQTLNGLYNRDNDTDNGITAREGGVMYGDQVAYPPGYLSLNPQNLIKGADIRWELWMDQLITACFLYRWGTTVATAMGVLYSYPFGTPEGATLTDAYDSDTDGEKNYLSDYTLDEIADWLANTYAMEEPSFGGREEAETDLTGLTSLRRAGAVWERSITSDDNVFGPDYGPIWNTEFLNCIKYIMRPELTTIREEVINKETYGLPFFAYHRPQIHYINVRRRHSGEWVEAKVMDYLETFGSMDGYSPGTWWGNRKSVLVTTSMYEFYGVDTAAMMLSAGWHYTTSLQGPHPDGGVRWNQIRPVDYRINLASSILKRYPSQFYPPELTGEIAGHDDPGAPVLEATAPIDEDRTAEVEAGYPSESEYEYEMVLKVGGVDGDAEASVKPGTAGGYTDMKDAYIPPWLR